MKRVLASVVLGSLMALTTPASAATYKIDTEGAHAFVQFRVKHLGYSWLYGRFNNFEGQFEYDSKTPEKSTVSVDIDMTSLDTNHAQRDKHLRSADYLDVKKYPKAKFVSTKYVKMNPARAQVHGDLTMHGVTKPIVMDIQRIGMGPDPWGGFRAGFEGRAVIKPAEWGINMKELGPASETVEILLTAEGIRQGGPDKEEGSKENKKGSSDKKAAEAKTKDAKKSEE